MKLNQSKLHQGFLQNYLKENLVPARKSAIFATSFYFLFSILDIYLAYPNYHSIVYTRIIFTLVMALVISLTYFENFKIHWQKLFSAYIIVAGIGIVFMSSFLNCPIKTLYAQGLLLVIFYGYTMNRLLLAPSAFTGISITLIYIITLFNSHDISIYAILTSMFFQISANIFGIFNINYQQKILLEEYILKNKNRVKSQKLTQLNQKLQKLASTDGLTGIANRRYFDKTLDAAIQTSKDKQTPLSLIMIDIDYFKLYNDYYGHVQGDTCLKQIAKLLEESIYNRPGLAARFGGEEFTVLLPDTNHNESIALMNKIINNLEKCQIENHNSPLSNYLTASYGVTTACKNYQTLSAKALVTSADSCLYKAKNNGRNQFISTLL